MLSFARVCVAQYMPKRRRIYKGLVSCYTPKHIKQTLPKQEYMYIHIYIRAIYSQPNTLPLTVCKVLHGNNNQVPIYIRFSICTCSRIHAKRIISKSIISRNILP